jgi:hypothetical protein
MNAPVEAEVTAHHPGANQASNLSSSWIFEAVRLELNFLQLFRGAQKSDCPPGK